MSDTHVIRDGGGTITVPSGVLGEIARRAAESVADVRVRRRGVAVDIDGDRARVSLEVTVRYGAVLPEVAGDAQERVAVELERMCGLEAAAVDIAVEELVLP